MQLFSEDLMHAFLVRNSFIFIEIVVLLAMFYSFVLIYSSFAIHFMPDTTINLKFALPHACSFEKLRLKVTKIVKKIKI